MRRLRNSVRYRQTRRPAPVSDTPPAKIVVRKCGVAGCDDEATHDKYCLCGKHYKLLPAHIKRLLQESRDADAQARSRAVLAALDYLDTLQGQLSTQFLENAPASPGHDPFQEVFLGF